MPRGLLGYTFYVLILSYLFFYPLQKMFIEQFCWDLFSKIFFDFTVLQNVLSLMFFFWHYCTSKCPIPDYSTRIEFFTFVQKCEEGNLLSTPTCPLQGRHASKSLSGIYCTRLWENSQTLFSLAWVDFLRQTGPLLFQSSCPSHHFIHRCWLSTVISNYPLSFRTYQLRWFQLV